MITFETLIIINFLLALMSIMMIRKHYDMAFYELEIKDIFIVLVFSFPPLGVFLFVFVSIWTIIANLIKRRGK